ncbi:ParB N-terminal domain-containing protein [Acidithiobacillus ferriphilus]|uniref:ParB N-terminal domain-containing protein n=1 Tax=Acidithiobacillus ferriphilus TaxID=1689834 RepID=UPI00232AE64B|nr:ParB N-terminal domain-containing protein [Acidithiobacillus ferriphilus]WCE94932.1 ParB N-terminal domain-containing protein [Acidithiobacillus ferriphilus]
MLNANPSKTIEVIHLTINSISIPPILQQARAQTLSTIENSNNIEDLDSNLSILYKAIKDYGLYEPIKVYSKKGKGTSYELAEGLLRFAIFKKLKISTKIPAVVIEQEDALHRAFIGNMAREDYSLPELAAWINHLISNGETENSIFTKFHIPRTRITHALFSITPEYEDLLRKYPETAITTLKRIQTAMASDSPYMQNPITRNTLLTTLKSLEGQSVPKSIIDSQLEDAKKVVDSTVLSGDGKTTYTRADSSSVYTKNNDSKDPPAPPVFYREATVTMDTFINSVAKIDEAIKKHNIAPDDIKVTIQITKQATAKLVNKEEQYVNNYDIVKWLDEK